jgi:protocatechuate 3,4-dioxygenase beta subunit
VSYRGVSDDRGYFRIPGLKPGEYYVASVENGAPDGGNYLPTYHPGVLDRSQSPRVRVEIDSETPAIAIRAIAGELLSLSGVVTSPDAGISVAQVSLHLFLDEKSRETRPAADGAFEFRSLSPGAYTLAALTDGGDGRALAAYQRVEVFQSVAGLSVSLAPAPEISLTLDAGPNAALQPGQILIMLSRVENYGRSTPRQAMPGAGEGRFESGPLLPGEWRPFLVTPDEYFVDEILVEGKSSLGGISLLPGDAKNVQVKLARNPGLISGRVLDEKGRIVPAAFTICYPLDDKNGLRLAGSRKMQANEKGEYRFGGLPPGDYLVAAISFVPDELEDQLPLLKARTRPTRIEPGSKIERDLTVSR